MAVCRRLWWLVALGGCQAVTADEFETCSVDLSLDRAKGAPGDVITGTGTPLTIVRDTVVEVGGVSAVVSDVTRSDACYDCDLCRSDATCAPCGLCAGIALDASERIGCFGDPLASPPVAGSCAECTESLTFVVPDVAPGSTSVFVVNRNGQSAAIPFEVLPAPPG